MKLRLAQPTVLVDIGRIGDLSYVEDGSGTVRIGAMTRHHDVASSDLVREQVPLLAEVAGQIGDPQVRHRGTVGGSIAHGDPASDLPAALLALRGTLVMRGPGGEREVPADEFFTGFLETTLAPDEVLTEIRVPAVPGVGWAFEKFSRRAQDWAIVGVAAVLTNGSTGPGVGLVNMGSVAAAGRGRRGGAAVRSVGVRRRGSGRRGQRASRRPQRLARVPAAPGPGPRPPRPGASGRLTPGAVVAAFVRRGCPRRTNAGAHGSPEGLAVGCVRAERAP